MKILRFNSEKSFLKALDGKIYAVCDHRGKYLCDILEESYIKLTDDGTLVDMTEDMDYRVDAESDVLFRSDIGEQGYEEFKEEYGVAIEIDKTIDEAIEYVRQNIDMTEVEYTIRKMAQRREPLYHVNSQLCDTIFDLLEEFGDDNDLPEGWYLIEGIDEEDILFKL